MDRGRAEGRQLAVEVQRLLGVAGRNVGDVGRRLQGDQLGGGATQCPGGEGSLDTIPTQLATPLIDTQLNNGDV